ncbi:GspH/FimT family pseudopilin [Ideonella sp. BN130291]|uniref:GspH/FimT family pseudopilin n=1 Tax=Ideonella sp. BN130291 TaxID=3112940 RepID=UPI002E25EDE5|nr:GspH/FimT family pseudopilin [Ideonella sp. BN130291]
MQQLTVPVASAKLRRQAGFTLIEAAVVMAVTGVLVMATLPSISSWLNTLRVRGVAESLQSGVQRARMEALRRNQDVSFWLVKGAGTNACAATSDAGSWVVVLGSADPSGGCATNVADGGTVIEQYATPATASSVAVKGSNGADGVDNVVFNAFGQVKPGGTPIRKIRVSLPGNTKVRVLDIDITTGGLVRMCDPNVGKEDTRACADAT